MARTELGESVYTAEDLMRICRTQFSATMLAYISALNLEKSELRQCTSVQVPHTMAHVTHCWFWKRWCILECDPQSLPEQDGTLVRLLQVECFAGQISLVRCHLLQVVSREGPKSDYTHKFISVCLRIISSMYH